MQKCHPNIRIVITLHQVNTKPFTLRKIDNHWANVAILVKFPAMWRVVFWWNFREEVDVKTRYAHNSRYMQKQLPQCIWQYTMILKIRWVQCKFYISSRLPPFHNTTCSAKMLQWVSSPEQKHDRVSYRSNSSPWPRRPSWYSVSMSKRKGHLSWTMPCLATDLLSKGKTWKNYPKMPYEMEHISQPLV